MPKESEKRKAEFKAGIFIIIILVLLIFSILWLKFFAIRPQMTLVAKFVNPGPVSIGFPVYYKGLDIGRISKLTFTEDYKYALLHLSIYQTGFRIPKNAYAVIRQQGITGQIYIDLTYPDSPFSEYLVDGDYIPGKTPVGLEEIQAFFDEQIKSGRLDRIISNLDVTLANTGKTSKRLNKLSILAYNLLASNQDEINGFFTHGAQAATDISKITTTVSDFIEDPNTKGGLRSAVASTSKAAESIGEIASDPEIRSGIKNIIRELGNLLGLASNTMSLSNTTTGVASGISGTLNNLNITLSDLDNLIKNLNFYTGDIYSDIKESNLIPNTSNVLGKTSNILGKTDNALGVMGETDQDGITAGLIINTVQNLNETLRNANEAAKQVDCLSEGLSDMFSKRFLLLRMLFGKPGSYLENCQNSQEMSKTKTGKLTAPQTYKKAAPCPGVQPQVSP